MGVGESYFGHILVCSRQCRIKSTNNRWLHLMEKSPCSTVDTEFVIKNNVTSGHFELDLVKIWKVISPSAFQIRAW
jgi:hypothetical protein